jgi:hypothetical protein
MSEGEQGYQEAIDALRDEVAFWTFMETHPLGEDAVEVANDPGRVCADYLEARRGGEATVGQLIAASSLGAGLEREVRAKVAAELRATLRPGTVDRAITVQAAARIAEGAEPRSWSLPTIPEDVKRVRDKDGEEWVPVAESPGDWQIDSPDWSRYEYASVADLIADYGPLVEVPDGTDV